MSDDWTTEDYASEAAYLQAQDAAQQDYDQLRARAERAEAWLGKFLAIDESPTSIYFNENVAIAFIRLQIECQAALAQPDAGGEAMMRPDRLLETGAIENG